MFLHAQWTNPPLGFLKGEVIMSLSIEMKNGAGSWEEFVIPVSYTSLIQLRVDFEQKVWELDKDSTIPYTGASTPVASRVLDDGLTCQPLKGFDRLVVVRAIVVREENLRINGEAGDCDEDSEMSEYLGRQPVVAGEVIDNE